MPSQAHDDHTRRQAARHAASLCGRSPTSTFSGTGGRNRKCADIYAKNIAAGTPKTWDVIEAEELNGQKLQAAGRDREKMAQLMEEHWEQIYELANKVEERIIRTTPPSAFPEPIVERLARADTDYDDDWKEKVIQWKEELSVKA